MAIKEYEQKSPVSLEEAQEMLVEAMQDTEKIWGQLNSDGFKRGFNGSKGEYENWRARAADAYSHKRAFVRDLIDYTAKKFNVRYSSLQAVKLAIAERSLTAPDWMSNGNGVHEEAHSVVETQAVEEVPLQEIVLSLQAQEQHDAILVRLLEARKAAGMNQEEVGGYFGITSNAIGKWERGQTPVTLSNIFKLAALYETDPLYILTGERGITKEILGDVAKHLEISLEALWALLKG